MRLPFRVPLVPLIVACAMFMENMDTAILATALPAIARTLNQDPVALKLALTAYLVSLAIFIPASSWISDRFGPRRVFRLALALYALASIGCAFSGTLAQFVAWRFVQGLGGAMMVPVGRALVVSTTSRSEIVRALMFLTIPSLVGPMIGPPLGGFIVTYSDWHWIFFLNVPIALIGITLATIHFPPDEDARPAPFDWAGFGLLGLGLGCLMLAAATTGRPIVPKWVTAIGYATSVAAILAYFRHMRRTPAPVLDLGLLKVPTMYASALGGAFFRIGSGAASFLTPLMLQLAFGLDALSSGLITFAGAGGALAMKPLAGRLLRWHGFRRVLIVNSFLASVLLGELALMTPTTPHVFIAGLLFLTGFSRSLHFTSLNALSFSDMPKEAIGRATSISAVAQQLSISLGVAIGAFSLEIAQGFRGHVAPLTEDFRVAIIVVSALSMLSFFSMLRVPHKAGDDIAGR